MHQRNALRFKKAFTLIELLVVIAIIAILSVVVIITLNPAELLRQSRDSNRLSDLDTINHVIALYSTDQSASANFFLGTASTTYISIPDPTATSSAGDQCQGLGLPVLATGTGYVYHCASSSTFRNTDGTGWIPVNLKNISSGVPLGSLPIDPVNQSSSNLFYAYTTDGTKFEITSILESQKYKSQLAINAPIVGYPEVAANGSSLSLSELYNPNGMIGYWPMDGGTGTVAQDISGNNNVGTWAGTQSSPNSTYYSTAKVGTYSAYFNGSNDYLSMSSIPSSALGSGFTYSAWIQTNSLSAGWMWPFASSAGSFLQCGKKSGVGDIRFDGAPFIYTGSALDTSGYNIADGKWHYFVCVWDGVNRSIYVDGLLAASVASTPGTSSTAYGVIQIGAHPGPGEFWNGLIDDAHLYNRGLSAAEIQAVYNAEK